MKKKRGSDFYDLMKADVFSLGKSFDEIISRMQPSTHSANFNLALSRLLEMMTLQDHLLRPKMETCLDMLRKIELAEWDEKIYLGTKNIFSACKLHIKQRILDLHKSNETEQIKEIIYNYRFYGF